ncbi:HNH endonuclease signature motif containing protein [Mycobacterium sp. Root265]|uniref:HNH endonuclease signature motif containing protein n=1 Tax=Mycobacterium sp. Root265 TaxID=1736504 RepID=UPI0009EC0768|nr:HNH endonuclease signature motif containing protein [Mycobacterium sp. Root265]
MIVDVDPEAVRRARQARQQRGITIEPIGDGMVEIHGRVDAAKGAVFDQGLDALARTVCPDDPRTIDERRADAVEPLTLGAKSIPCLCGREGCPVTGNEAPKGHIVIHVLAEQGTVTGESGRPAVLPGYGVVASEQVQEMLPHAEVRPVPDADELGSEPGYHPSRKLADFVRCRDVTCRWPGCNALVDRCDVDHTVPWPYGPTHPSNTKLYCRIHHLIKTFHCGPGGWTDKQHPDGTVTLTAPSGRVYTTKPDGGLFFPQLAVPTGEWGSIVVPPPSPHRALAAPRRRRTRAQNLAYRIAHERALNRADIEANPPPF